MSRSKMEFVVATVSSGLVAIACAAGEELSTPLGGVGTVTEGGSRDATTREQSSNGGQTGSSTMPSSSVRQNTGGMPGTSESSTGGRTTAGNQNTTSNQNISSSGGTLPIWSTNSLGTRSATGGVNGLTPITGSAALGGAASDGPTNTGSTASTRSGAEGGGTSANGSVPVLPAISGTCPSFKTGTITVAGLSGISLQVGAKKEGTGSLLFYWHGTGSSVAEVSMMIPSSVKQEILDQGGIIAAFQSSLGTGGDCSGTATFSKDDFKVADQIAACAVRDYGIDPRRIYTTGCSAGGLQSGCMAALRSSYLAASVPNSGGEVMTQTIQDPAHIPAVMTMHGGATDMVIVTFSQTSATFDKHMDDAGGFVINCNHGGGHCGAPAALYTAGWEFMKAHPFGTKPSPYASGLPTSFPNYCSIY